MDIAEQYPRAQVCSIDLSPIEPGWVPPNCSFLVENAENDWIYSLAQAFDFINLRALAGSIKHWPKVFSQIFQYLKPGAWAESQENDSSCFSDDDSLQKQWMIDAGFVDVQEKVCRIPVGQWAKDKKMKEQGMYAQALSADALEPISMALFTRVLGMSAQEVQAILVGRRKDIMNPNLHLYIKFRFVRQKTTIRWKVIR
ncbi:hypothetical protein L207DRAFT_540708 [Hyaloscypha variabilis F]|uniref:S-adenosyl-L-methionine-dependent methyltransferase n=1 Tax=Hyaloscypha variabilis (strain UAMH 11265 / GT02V1 / F) TaxID=1149755 RepID=A0A2J6S5H3_HYAVF|nr:hypothetical protein L207DRAFT_540708 [Hyaloscypha variabilis F]